jgi:hypothetical protein
MAAHRRTPYIVTVIDMTAHADQDDKTIEPCSTAFNLL